MATATGTMNPETAELFAKYVVPNYTRFPLCLVRGEGSYVWTTRAAGISISFPVGAAIFLATARRASSKLFESKWPS